MIQDMLRLQLDLMKARCPYALATVIEIFGSSSAKPTAKAVIDGSGKLVAGWVGGGCAQAMVGKAALDCFETGDACVIDIDLNDEIFGAGMPCGGSMRVYVEPVLPKPILWLMGHGRIVESVSDFAYQLGFEIVVYDPLAKSERFPNAARIENEADRYQKLLPQSGDYVVIATHHKGDYESLTQVLRSDAIYIALLSSRKRANLIIQRLKDEGFSDAELAKVRAPAGLNLGAKLPEEIALAIVSEMVMIRRGGGGEPMCKSP